MATTTAASAALAAAGSRWASALVQSGWRRRPGAKFRTTCRQHARTSGWRDVATLSMSEGTAGSGSSKGFGESVRRRAEEASRSNPRDAMLGAIQGVHQSAGRVSNSTNIVFAAESDEDWKKLDDQVNVYPSMRTFKAIGSGGEDFKDSMVAAVEGALNVKLDIDRVALRESSGGKYQSIQIGPVEVFNPEQVVAIYQAMKKDPRLRYFI